MCVFDDGTKAIGAPTGVGLWYVSGSGSVDPEPGTGDFIAPFSFDTVEPGGEYGPRDGTRFHEGIDFPGGAVGGVGTPILVAGDGTVDQNYYHGAFGNLLIVDHGIMPAGTYAGKRVKTLYAHMVDPSPLAVSSPTVAGSTVAGGVGNTGSASVGAHLHWEVHVMEPGGSIVWNTSNDGGFRTAVSPRDFMGEYG